MDMKNQEGYMGPHPLSETRRLAADDPAVMTATLKNVYKLRNDPYWMTNSKSLTHQPIEKPIEEQEYKSLTGMMTDRRKHVRTATNPQDKYYEPATTGQEVGWLQNDASYPDGGTGWLRKPTAPVRSSKMTKYYDNMQLTHSYHILRFAR